jgi:outer membrane protein OmpA-like peptidoglycan-associated protein
VTTTVERRGTSRRRAGLALALIALNVGLVVVNLAKRDVLPFAIGPFGDSETESVAGPAVTDGAGATVVTASGETTVPSSAPIAPVVTGGGAVTVDTSGADWPQGAGPPPEGPPQPRRAYLKPDGRLELSGSAPNWATATKIVQFAGEKLPGGEASVDNQLTWHPAAPLDPQAGEVLVDQAATFPVGEAVIDPASFPILDLTAQVLISHPTVFAVVVGHTDDVGDENTNAQLALDRANAVVTYLVGKGVVGGQLVVASAGEDDPMASNETQEGRDANRRIEIQFKNFLIAAPNFGGTG